MPKLALIQKSLPVIDILLVEDNPSDAFLLSNLLESGKDATYKTHLAKSHAEALTLLAEQEFDVCLLDLTLPDTHGFSALVGIQEAAPGMPVLILTGMRDAELAKRAVGRGAQDYLLKDEIETLHVTRAIDYALERKRIEKELFQRANHDVLTGLANREVFMTRLGMALARSERTGTGVAILFLDLDRFKPINDTHGHDAGDEALKIVSQRIRSVLRSYDTAARFGGDEFALLLEGVNSARNAAAIAQKIIKVLSAPMPYHQNTLELGASIGIACSEVSASADTLLQHADIAMYHAKKAGGGEYRFFASSMYDEAVERLSLEEDLRVAMRRDELRLYYQPYVTPDGKTVLGVEALLRWAHPERGIMSAHEFLPTAEEARLMPDIAKWVCAQLHRDIDMWNKHGLPPCHIATNVSLSQLDSLDLIEWLKPLADKEFLRGNTLAIEIPEQALSQISGARFMTLAKLHDMGIKLHLDNFGCGILPLTTLCALPFSLLKLDMALIKNMSSDLSENVLIGTAITLAHHLGMKAGAVGVEALWQANILEQHVCDSMQGFLTVEPMSAQQWMQWRQKDTRVSRAL